ncbi:hypothetical protein BM43_1072 [Burkholderia gladioli]|uniref:Uncharacterized protein n=1 Tax=Burkholderia gladioli TaxID=28095 RepID=A0AAW3F5T6_BURGA|nr:hypothetical protein BM43_1072 [Burkholderia gladioli]ASD80935.1 hypothetical protein CEJ98_19465 [Burkholderia gladioli pv. gladioli]KGC16910.1 hypothetical protein DM48_4573 [Burkholderia gladioli]SQA88628.1 Uncharacterised protein [Burkholderia gladioli]
MQMTTTEAHQNASLRVTPKAPKKERHGAKLDRLRRYLRGGHYLIDRTQPLTLQNLKTQTLIAEEVGLRSSADVSLLVRREFPEVATVLSERDAAEYHPAPKKDRLLRYIASGGHLRDPLGELTASNLRTQREIADELGMTQMLVSYHIRQHAPAVAAVMASRRWYDAADRA